MKFFCISDNTDTKTGLRLAGIEGVLAHSKEEVEKALEDVCKNEQVGVVLISHKLMNLCPEKIYDIKLNLKVPLILQIPDRHGDFKISEKITEYVHESIGVKI